MDSNAQRRARGRRLDGRQVDFALLLFTTALMSALISYWFVFG